MKAECKSIILAVCHSFNAVVCAVSVILLFGVLAGSAQTGDYLYSGSETTITLNAGTYYITAYGAAGGGINNGFATSPIGGLGAEMRGEFTFSEPTTLTLLVGGAGSGAGGYFSAGGGGGSFVVDGSTPLVIAGGGGGWDVFGNDGGPGLTGTSGGNNGGGVGGSGGSGGTGGGGGGYSGSGGSGSGGGGYSFLSGGAGGVGGPNNDGYGGGGYGGGGGSGTYGGGGGGGYSGGAGGSGNGGGGGGGSIIDSSAIMVLAEVSGVASPDGSPNGEIIITTYAYPVQYAANPTNGLVPLSVQFTSPGIDSQSNTITSWNWNFGDGTTSTQQNPLHVYTNIGTFQPSLVVTNNLGLAVPGTGPVITIIGNTLVTTTSDSGLGTLRQAIANATNDATITFATNLSGATITLSNTLTINTNLTIDASALTNGIQINGNGAVTIFNVASSNVVVFNSLTITNGYAVGYPGGGGIINQGTLTVNNCTLSGNVAGTDTAYQGGAIVNFGKLMVNECTLSGNSGYYGGCIFNSGGTMTLNQCTLSGNNTTVTGAILNEGTLSITNTIVAGNSGVDSGDIDNADTLTFGGANLVQSVGQTGGHGTVTGPAPINAAPLLAPLGNYGAPTQTMPLLPGSPAIGAGSVAANIFATDQRGYPRTQSGLIDIGAVEMPTLHQFTASPTNGFAPLTVQFNSPNVDSDGSAIINWNWSFGDGSKSTNQNPAHAYTTVGGFSPGLVVTNSLGLTLAASGPSITVPPPPAITSISLSGTNLLLNGANAVSGLTFYVLASTNLALPLSQWTPVSTNLWSANGRFNLTVTNAVNPRVPQLFYLLQVP
jgi:PKD repeat protein